jgi:hypothetical protein
VNIVLVGIAVGILIVLVRLSRAVTSIAHVNALRQLHEKPARELLPLGWGLVEVGDVIEVAYGQLEGLHEVTGIEDEGRISLSPARV